MKDVLDRILDSLPQSTLELIQQYEGRDSRVGHDVDDLLGKAQLLQNRRALREMHRKHLDVKARALENSSTLARLVDGLKKVEATTSGTGDARQSAESLRKKLLEYDNQITEMAKTLGGTDTMDLFNDIETLNREVETLTEKIREVKKKFECYDDFPPNIEEAKKVIAEVKERIKNNEKEIDSMFH